MTKWLAVLLLTTACTDATDADAAFRLLFGAAELIGDDSGSNGDDVLPKRGDHAGDPTIISARAFCSGSTVLFVGVEGSDPRGSTNLATCTASARSAATIGSATAQASFMHTSCYLRFGSIPCTSGDAFAVDITISNETRGETAASVSLTAE